MVMLPIASGKGGVGKSLIAANLAIAFAKAGKRVVLVDLDLGGSNLHTILGMRGLPKGIGTFLNGRAGKLSSVSYETEYERLVFIPGDSEIPGMANLTTAQKSRLLRQLGEIDADYVVADLGSGTSHHTVDFFLASPAGILVTTPHITAILNAYLFLKSSVFRLLTRSFDRASPASRRLAELRKSPETMQRLYVPALVDELAALDRDGAATFRERISGFRPSMIINLLDDPRDAEKAGKIRRSCRHYLGIEVDHLGVIYRDGVQNTALASGLPILVYKPETVLSRGILRIAEKILDTDYSPRSPAELELFDEAFNDAAVDAESDYEYRIESMQDLLDGGVLSQGDLIETIRNQQYEIGRLRRENIFLKSKLLDASHEGFRV